MNGYPKWFSKNLISIVFFVLFITGIFLVPNMLEHRFGIDSLYLLEGTLRLLTTSTHVLFSYLILIILGALMVIHVKSGLKKKKNLKSGFFIIGSFLVLLITGILLLYAASESVISISSLAHTLVGLLTFLIYLVHLSYRKKANSE